MPLSIPNTTLQDAYVDATTFGQGDIFSWGFFTVANAGAFVQLYQGVRGQGDWQPEVFCPPATYPIAGSPSRPVSGIRARNAVAGTPCQFFGSIFYPNEPGIQAGTPFSATISATGAVGVGVGVLNRDTSLIDVAATNAETTLYTFNITGGTMSIDSLLRLTLKGDFLYNNNIADTLTIRVKFGGATILSNVQSGAALSALRFRWKLRVEIPNLGSLTSQDADAEMIANTTNVGTPATGIGRLTFLEAANLDITRDSPNGGLLGTAAPLAVDTAVAQTLAVTAQWSAASANDSFRKRYGILEIL